jgi:hypothetical protein
MTRSISRREARVWVARATVARMPHGERANLLAEWWSLDCEDEGWDELPDDLKEELNSREEAPLVAGRRQRYEANGSIFVGGVDPVEEDGVEVDVERQGARKPLDDGDATGLSVRDVVTPLRPSTQIGKDGANEGPPCVAPHRRGRTLDTCRRRRRPDHGDTEHRTRRKPLAKIPQPRKSRSSFGLHGQVECASKPP